MMKRTSKIVLGIGAVAASLGVAMAATSSQDEYSRLRGVIRIDGSSTVYPITEAVAEEFRKVAPNVRVTVGISGTGGGFKRFVVGETDISDASRPIKAKEYKAAKENGLSFIEVPVAYDGLSIVVNPENDWVDQLTVAELKKIFLAGTGVDSWNDVRPEWPNVPMKIFAPGTDSGTFDYFKEVVAEDDKAIRSDMSVSEDDNVLVRGVAGDRGAIGFFGYAYYVENQDKLKVVPIVNPNLNTPVQPTPSTIESGEYAPFSRPLFIYVSADSLRRPEVKGFIDFYLHNAAELADEVGYVRLPKWLYDKAEQNVQRRKTGTHFLNDDMEKIDKPLAKAYR